MSDTHRFRPRADGLAACIAAPARSTSRETSLAATTAHSLTILFRDWNGAASGRPAMNRPRAYYTDAADADLLCWSAAGDRQAFDEIVARHGPFALRVAMRLVANPAAAEDIVQEAMVRAWSQATQFDPRRARFTTWFTGSSSTCASTSAGASSPTSCPTTSIPSIPLRVRTTRWKSTSCAPPWR